MIKKFFIVLVIIANVNFCFGQVSVGAKVGLNSNKLTVYKNEFKSESTRFGFVMVRFLVREISRQIWEHRMQNQKEDSEKIKESRKLKSV